MIRKKIFRLVIALLLLIGVVMVLNMEVSIRQGVNYSYRLVKMPLYVKWTQFLARHYEYARLAREITSGCKTDKDKVLAVLTWTHENIKDQPDALPQHDDHILNIIIRGFGVPEQFQDVFTTLCTYAGMPAYWVRLDDKSRKARYAISLVNLNGSWRVFDAYHGIYFRTKAGEMATLDDIVRDPSIVSGKDVEVLRIDGVPYKDFFYTTYHFSKPAIIRPEQQMPLPRLMFETRKAFGIDKDMNN